MIRLAAACILFSFILAFLITQQTPVGRPAQEFYPLRPGLRWIYRGPLGTTVIRQVLEERDGLYHMRFDLPLMGSHVLPMRYSRDGVAAVRDGREILLLKLPMRIGDQWRIDLPGYDERAECLVEGREQTPWGLATKLRVTRANLKTGKRWTDFEWYVDGYGLVQMEVTYGLRARFALEKFEQPVVRRTAPPK